MLIGPYTVAVPGEARLCDPLASWLIGWSAHAKGMDRSIKRS